MKESTTQDRRDLDVRLGVLSCRVEGEELIFRELRLHRVGDIAEKQKQTEETILQWWQKGRKKETR